MAWLQAASFGISALGHVLNRTGGRKKVKATLADTSFIEDEVDTIRQRNNEMGDKFLRTANAGVGFADATKGRMRSAMGVGGANSMLDSAQMGGFEQAGNMALANEAQSQGQINQLMNTQARMEQFNAQAQNNAAATNFQAARADNNNMFGALSAGMMSFANQRLDNKRFGMAMDQQASSRAWQQKMYEQWMKNQSANGQTGSNGIPLPTVPYGSNF